MALITEEAVWAWCGPLHPNSRWRPEPLQLASKHPGLGPPVWPADLQTWQHSPGWTWNLT